MHLDNLPPDAVEYLKNHEADDILADPTKLVLDLTDPSVQQLLANANSASQLAARERALDAATKAATIRDNYRKARDRSVPQTIGVRGIDPRSGFDCRFDPATRILWVPVMIYSAPLPPKNPAKRINPYTQLPVFQVGQTSIQHSTVSIPFTLPNSTTVERTIRGFCILELSDHSPEETIALLEQRLGRITASDDDENASHEPAFIPSLQPPTPESRPALNPNSPFTIEGHASRPTAPARTTPIPLAPDVPPFNLDD